MNFKNVFVYLLNLLKYFNEIWLTEARKWLHQSTGNLAGIDVDN